VNISFTASIFDENSHDEILSTHFSSEDSMGVFVKYTGGERDVHTNDYRLGWCFYINVIGTLSNIATAVLFFLRNPDDFKKV
jgi:hypothetical protein